MEAVWTLQDAKNRFSEVVEHALHGGPQTITRRGKATAVIVSVAVFRALAGGKGDLVQFLQDSPMAGAELDTSRRREFGRGVDL